MTSAELDLLREEIEARTVYRDWRIAKENGDEKTAAALECELKKMGKW